MSTETTYNPSGLFDTIMANNQLKNDAALSRFLGVAPPVISKMRNQRLPVGPAMILKAHEIGGLTVADVRGFIGGAA